MDHHYQPESELTTAQLFPEDSEVVPQTSVQQAYAHQYSHTQEQHLTPFQQFNNEEDAFIQASHGPDHMAQEQHLFPPHILEHPIAFPMQNTASHLQSPYQLPQGPQPGLPQLPIGYSDLYQNIDQSAYGQQLEAHPGFYAQAQPHYNTGPTLDIWSQFSAAANPVSTTQNVAANENHELASADGEEDKATARYASAYLSAHHHSAGSVFSSPPPLSSFTNPCAYMTSPPSNNPGQSTTHQPAFTSHYNAFTSNNDVGCIAGTQLDGLGTYGPLTSLPNTNAGNWFDADGAAQNIHVLQPASQVVVQQPLAQCVARAASSPKVGKRDSIGRRYPIRSAKRDGVKRWTPEEVRRAQQMRLDGFSSREIGEVLHRTGRSVAAKIWRADGNDAHQSDKRRLNGM